jgi:hypothetical protein
MVLFRRSLAEKQASDGSKTAGIMVKTELTAETKPQ